MANRFGKFFGAAFIALTGIVAAAPASNDTTDEAAKQASTDSVVIDTANSDAGAEAASPGADTLQDATKDSE